MAEPAVDQVYAVIFIDAINVKIREGQVATGPSTWRWASRWTASATSWACGPASMAMARERSTGCGFCSEIKNRGVRDVCMLVCDGLKGLPDAVSTVWQKTIVQTCIVHLLRNSFKYASKRDWAQIAKDLRPVYTAASEAEALDRFAEFSGKWEKRYPAIIRLWENAWAEFVPFLRLRPGNPDRHLLHECHRVDQRPAPPRGERPRPLPDRAGRPQVPLPGGHEPGPHRQGPQTLNQPVEGRPQRLRHHLRRPPQRGQEVTTRIELRPFRHST